MDVLQLQIRRARRRMVLEQFLSVVTWSLFVTLLVAVVGVAIPKIWVLAVDSNVWMWSWIGGAVGAGLLTAMIWTWCIRRSALEAAIEIDRRFGLKERVSSALALGPEERETEIGKALVIDTARRVERIDVKEKFRVSPNWRTALPLLPAAIVALLALLPNAVMKKTEAAAEISAKQNQTLKKKLAVMEHRLLEKEPKKGEDAKLEDGEFEKELAKKVRELMSKENVERKEIFLKLNDLAQDIEKKKKDLSSADDLKKELGKLKDIEKGPADKFAEALKEGDLGKAQEELKKLTEAAKKGELKEEDKQALARQLEKIKEQIEEKKQQRDQAKKELEEQIKQKMDAGDQAGAEKLQQKLDEMKQQEQQAQQKMEQMAQKLGECAQCMKQGGQQGNQQAAQKLDQLAKDLKNLENELKEIENLDELLDELADAKDAMQGEEGQDGAGQQAEGNDGEGNDGKDSDEPGKGKTGKGRGQGARDEEENKTGFYDSRVADKARKGQSVRIGDAGGKNVKGKSSIEVREAIITSKNEDPDAQNETALPREQREHSKQYFENFRKGEIGTLNEDPAAEEPGTK